MDSRVPTIRIIEHDPDSLRSIAKRQIASLKRRMISSMRRDAYIQEINKIIIFENQIK